MSSLRSLFFIAILILAASLGLYGLWITIHPQVVVEWSTASELNTAGYNLYRSQSLDGPAEQVNPDLIAASPDPLTGGDYSYSDSSVRPGQTYYYWLEDVDASGSTSRNGPVEVRSAGLNSGGWTAALAMALTGLAGLIIEMRRRRLDQRPAGLTLSIGGLRLSIESPDAALVQALRGRFHDFLSPAERSGERPMAPHLTLNLTTLKRPGGQAAGVFTSGLLSIDQVIEEALRNGKTSFTSPSYEGHFDLVDGQARLSLSSSNLLDDVEYYVRVCYALLVFDRQGLMFHAAGVVRNGRGYLFFGHSGAGKTTVARLSSTDTVLNDDLVVLMPPASGRLEWGVYATPFTNPTQVRPNQTSPSEARAPLAALLRLVQDHQVYVEPLSPALALAEMVSNVPVIALDRQRSPLLLERLAALLNSAPVFNLHFLPDPSFWPVVDGLDLSPQTASDDSARS